MNAQKPGVSVKLSFFIGHPSRGLLLLAAEDHVTQMSLKSRQVDVAVDSVNSQNFSNLMMGVTGGADR